MTGKPLGKSAMTATERQRKWRAKIRRRELLAGHRDHPSLRTPPLREDDRDFWPTPPYLGTSGIPFYIAYPEGIVDVDIISCTPGC
jgi:hypothetical protein